MDKKLPKTFWFCWNSRRWGFTIDIFGIPESCPRFTEKGQGCEHCGYYAPNRELTPYAKRMLQNIYSWREGEK